MGGASIMEVATKAGLLSLNPSDLVFEANQMGIAYYDYVLSASQMQKGVGYQLFLAKLDEHTNVEWFETVQVDSEVITKNTLPANELTMITLGILVWRQKITSSKVLCLVHQLDPESTLALEALKKAAAKLKILHHVLTIGSRRSSSVGSTTSSMSNSSIKSNTSQEGMKLRVMMCQTRSELPDLPAHAIRDTRYLLLKMSMKKHLRHVLLWIYDKNNQIKGDDAVEEIREVYGHDSIGRMTVFRWLKKFRNGDKNVDDLEDDPRSGRPSKFNEKCLYQNFLNDLIQMPM